MGKGSSVSVLGVLICILHVYPALSDYTSCPDKWVAFKGSCYLFGHGDLVSFFEAEHFCRQQGGNLVHIDNAVENAFLVESVRVLNKTSYWIGLTDEAEEGTWRWLDTSTNATFTDWSPGEPNNFHDLDEDCACLAKYEHYKWNDSKCRYIGYEPICQIRNTEISEIVG